MPDTLSQREQRALHVLRAQITRARELAEEHLECRLVRHAWKRIVADRDAPYGVALAFECLRCTGRRYDYVDPKFGTLLGRYYLHPRGYLLHKPSDGSKAMSMEALRVEMVRRTTQEMAS